MTLPRQFAWAVLTTALTVASMPVWADKAPASRAVISNNVTLQERLDRLFKSSALWRDAATSIERLGRKVVVVTPKNIKVKDPQTGKLGSFDDGVLAEVQPLAEHETRVDAVVVVINLTLLERMRAPGTAQWEFHDDLDRVLAHEVYGHAFPYLLAGDLAGRCADPAPGEKAENSCAIQRENAIRAEMRLGSRTDYGLSGLTLARRFRD